MNKMKKALLILLSMAMSATLFVACGKKDNPSGNENSSSPSTGSVDNSSSLEDSSSSEEHSHEYTELKYDAENHWYECECGEESGKEGHKGGEAACTGAAVCVVCEQSYGSVGEHIYNVPNKDETYHWYECGCGEIDESSKVAHEYSEAKKDETNHWNECVCGATSGVTAHEYTIANKDETNHWNECVCGAIDENSKVAHEYSEAKKDETNHWNECSCGATSDVTAHEYTIINKDETSHWNECVCGATSNVTAHEYSEIKKDETNHWNECSCGATSDVTAHEYTIINKDETSHWNECVCGVAQEKVGHSGGAATCTEQAVCDICKQAYGEVEDHKYNVLVVGEEADTLACACGEPEANYVFNKVVSVERQELLLTNANGEISLEGISAYTSVSKIYLEKTVAVQVEGGWQTTKEELSLGTDISKLDFSAIVSETKFHGETSIFVVVADEKGEHTISVPVTLITKEIKELADWTALQTSAADGITYGYYVLKNNIAFTGNGYGNAVVINSTTSGEYGFRGTLVGNGYTVSHSGSWWTNGLFGAIGTGAVLKDVTFTQSQSLNYAANRFVFGRIVVGATFNNVVINLYNQTPVGGNTSTTFSPLAYDGFVNCTMKNVKVNVENSTINSLFGGGENAYLGLKNTTFESCIVNMKAGASVSELGHNGKPGEETNVVYTAAGLEVEGATVLEGIVFEYNSILLATNQVIDLSKATYAIDLGADYANYTAKSIKLDAYDLGTNLSDLAIPDALKTDKAKHGVYNIVVVAEYEGKEKEFTAPVTLATKAISTMADLNATVTCTDATGDIYGYYVLMNDISDGEEGLTIIAGKQGWASTVAFRGTLDGRGHTISMNTSKWGNRGLFGTMNGATVKNVDFVDAWNNNSAILAWAAYNITLADVTITINNGKTCAGTAGNTPIFANAFQGNSTLTNVTITTKVAMPVMFAATATNYLKCSNVTINGDVTAFSTNESAFPTGITTNKTVA
ncbi:MAG: hypothetical protein IJV83_04195 [Clostridia bacterium]|nr:hypothetical protein [Clostridia bacterium]